MDNTCKTFTYTGTAAALGLNIGFVPKFMEIYDAYGGLAAIWDDSMADGEMIILNPFQDGVTSDPAPSIGSTTARCANKAFQVRILNVADIEMVNVAAVAAGTAPTATTVPVSTYGAFGYEVAIDGTIDAGWDAAANATGYASEALAIAAIRAVAASANHVRAFFFTVTSSSGAYVGNTTALNASQLTVNYYSFSDLRPYTGGITIRDESEYVTSGTIYDVDKGTSRTPTSAAPLQLRGPELGTNAYINKSGGTYICKAYLQKPQGDPPFWEVIP